MALKHYIATTVANAETDIPISSESSHEVEMDYELAIVTMRISGGANGGDLYFRVYRNESSTWTKKAELPFSIAAEEVVVIDSKDFYEAGDVLRIAGDPGITVELSADYSSAS